MYSVEYLSDLILLQEAEKYARKIYGDEEINSDVSFFDEENDRDEHK